MECDNVIAISIAPALKITYQRKASDQPWAWRAAMLKFYFLVYTASYPLLLHTV